MADSRVSMSPKRKNIADSNRTMFIWIAGMSVVVGICAVLAVTLGRQIIFHANVVSNLTKTADTLKANNKSIQELTDNILLLETNTGLNATKAFPDEKALQVVLDSLPADRNTLALGSSLQQRLLSGIDGLDVASIVVDDSTNGGGDVSSDSSVVQASLSSTVETIPISIAVTATGSVNSLKDLLSRLERSIRIIDIDKLTVEVSGDSNYSMAIQAHAYYQPAKSIQLTDEVIPR